MASGTNFQQGSEGATITSGGTTVVNFILAGFIRNAVICLIIGIAMTIGTLFVIRSVVRRNAAEQA